MISNDLQWSPCNSSFGWGTSHGEFVWHHFGIGFALWSIAASSATNVAGWAGFVETQAGALPCCMNVVSWWLASWADVAYRRLAPEHLRFLQVVAWCALFWSPQNAIPIGASRNRNCGRHLALLPFRKWTMDVDELSCFCLLLAELLSSSMHEFIYIVGPLLLAWRLAHWNGFFHHIRLAKLLIVESFMILCAFQLGARAFERLSFAIATCSHRDDCWLLVPAAQSWQWGWPQPFHACSFLKVQCWRMCTLIA